MFVYAWFRFYVPFQSELHLEEEASYRYPSNVGYLVCIMRPFWVINSNANSFQLIRLIRFIRRIPSSSYSYSFAPCLSCRLLHLH